MNFSTVCVDASIIIKALVPGLHSDKAIELLEKWLFEDISLVAPTLLAFEVTSVLRQEVYLKNLVADEGDAAFHAFLQMPIRYSRRNEVVKLAWQLSKMLNRSRAYDTAYLAVAQLNRCEFWTADKRLYNAAHPTLAWVRWIEESL